MEVVVVVGLYLCDAGGVGGACGVKSVRFV